MRGRFIRAGSRHVALTAALSAALTLVSAAGAVAYPEQAPAAAVEPGAWFNVI